MILALDGADKLLVSLSLSVRGNRPLYPLYRGLCGPQAEENVLFPILGIEPRLLSIPARSLVTISTELSWFP
jgi:hypothetical protein